MTTDASPVPGLGRVQCKPLTIDTGARALKAALSLGKWVLEHPFELAE